MEKYFVLCRAAHDAGKMRSPALDSLIMQELEDMPVGTGAVEILTAWTDGWDAGRAAYMERMEAMRWEPYTEGGQP